jgi:hypothetical protein
MTHNGGVVESFWKLRRFKEDGKQKKSNFSFKLYKPPKLFIEKQSLHIIKL